MEHECDADKTSEYSKCTGEIIQMHAKSRNSSQIQLESRLYHTLIIQVL